MCGPGPCRAPVPCGRCERVAPLLAAERMERPSPPPFTQVSDNARTLRTLSVIPGADQER